ncbi:MAG: hypothetical protein ACRC68_15950, partial [Clostridium sp.]
IKKEILYKLEEQFGEVKYNKKDFEDFEDVYYIYVDSPKSKIYERIFDDPIIYIGCIFIKDDRMYYGNRQNEIKDELKNNIIEVIKK